MRVNNSIKLDIKPGREKNIFDFIESRAVGKSVLNVGAAGGVISNGVASESGYLPNKKEFWPHHRLQKVSKHLVGIDIDSEAIAYAKKHGIEIKYANCETAVFDTKFDIIIMGDVIEHLNAPVIAIKNLMSHLKPDGCLVIITPNMTSLSNFVKIVFFRPLSVYYDHMHGYCPEHIQAICERLGYRLAEVKFLTLIDNRNLSYRVKSHILSFLSIFFPAFAPSFVAVVKHV
jgi:SAM-dependent methyltransferase